MAYATPNLLETGRGTKCYQSAHIQWLVSLITTVCHSYVGSHWNHFQAFVCVRRTTLQIWWVASTNVTGFRFTISNIIPTCMVPHA